LASGLSKLQGASWWGGTAVWGTMANFEFSPMRYRLYMDFLYFLADHRWAWELFVTSGVVFTLVFEIGFPLLVWLPRWRWTMVVAAVMLHTGIALFMGLVSFSIIMMVGVAAFLPAGAVRRFVALLSRSPAVLPVGGVRPAPAPRVQFE